MSYANVVWANCDKESVYGVLRLQKRAARVICYADRMTPSVALFNKLQPRTIILGKVVQIYPITVRLELNIVNTIPALF